MKARNENLTSIDAIMDAECLQGREQHLAIAFIYLSDELTATAELEEKMKIALSRISEKLSS